MSPLAWVLVMLVRAYQLIVRPVIGANCRFEPHCSAYAIEALRIHGAVRGSGLAAWRVLRCNPWCEGGYDPVPPCGCHGGRAAPHGETGL
jgi:putative membrane protein insertion efficiency factor